MCLKIHRQQQRRVRGRRVHSALLLGVRCGSRERFKINASTWITFTDPKRREGSTSKGPLVSLYIKSTPSEHFSLQQTAMTEGPRFSLASCEIYLLPEVAGVLCLIKIILLIYVTLCYCRFKYNTISFININ